MTEDDGDQGSGLFDVAALAATLPETATTLLADRYLADRASASARVFRVYRPTPPHYHVGSDEHLFILSGRASFWMGDPKDAREIGPGQLVIFPRGTVHAMAAILEHPFVALAIDAPRRNPTDIVFVDPDEGTPETFMQRNAVAPASP